MTLQAKRTGPFQFRLSTLFVVLAVAAFCFAYPLFSFCVAGMIVLIVFPATATWCGFAVYQPHADPNLRCLFMVAVTAAFLLFLRFRWEYHWILRGDSLW